MNGEELIRADLEARLGFGVKAVDAIPEGHSGFTYLVTAERGNYVLRIPPPWTRFLSSRRSRTRFGSVRGKSQQGPIGFFGRYPAGFLVVVGR